MDTESYQPKKILGIRTSAIIETIVYLSALLIFDFYYGSRTHFISTYPHPFWAIVLLITVQYGAIEGLVSALLATLFLYAGNIPNQLIEETSFEYQFRIAFRPFLWFSSAFILGGLRVRLQERIDKLQIERDEACNQSAKITKNYQLLKTTKENLEARFAGQITTVAATYGSLRGLETLNPGHILTSLEDIIKSSLNPIKFSIFASGPNGLEATAAHGWSETDQFQRRFSSEHPLFVEVVKNKRLICITNEKDEIALSGEGVLAVPLLDPGEDVVFGIMKIEETDFLSLGIGDIETAKSLCNLIGSAYSNAKKYKKAMSQTIYTEKTEIYSNKLFPLLTQYILNLMKKAGSPMSILSIEVQNSSAMEINIKQRIAKDLYALLNQCLPENTPIFNGEKNKIAYQAPLAGLTEKQSKEICSTILENILKNTLFKDVFIRIKPETLFDPQIHADCKL